MPLCVTFLLCFWEVQYGIVAGVLVSGILLLYSIARPPIKVGFTPRLGCGGASRARKGVRGWERASRGQHGVGLQDSSDLLLPYPVSPACHRCCAGTPFQGA